MGDLVIPIPNLVDVSMNNIYTGTTHFRDESFLNKLPPIHPFTPKSESQKQEKSKSQ